MQEQLREAAAQLEEDAQDCWGIRRKMNLRAAAKLLREAADELEQVAVGPSLNHAVRGQG